MHAIKVLMANGTTYRTFDPLNILQSFVRVPRASGSRAQGPVSASWAPSGPRLSRGSPLTLVSDAS